MDAVAPKSHFSHDPVWTLYRLWGLCFPEAARIFTANNSPLRLLHMNDYVLEKTFVYGIISVTKWLGKEWFPCGLRKWPPKMPENLIPKFHDYSVVDVDTTTPSQAMSSSSGAVPAGEAASSSASKVHSKSNIHTTAPSQAQYSSSAAVHPDTAKSSPYKRLKLSNGK